jgi:hypothetical protein
MFAQCRTDYTQRGRSCILPVLEGAFATTVIEVFSEVCLWDKCFGKYGDYVEK